MQGDVAFANSETNSAKRRHVFRTQRRGARSVLVTIPKRLAELHFTASVDSSYSHKVLPLHRFGPGGAARRCSLAIVLSP